MFDIVVIKRLPQSESGNIHLALHPFHLVGPEWIRSFKHKGDFDTIFDREPLPEWQQKLVDELFESLPGLQTVFFKNGEITLQHSEVFSDDEIVEAATKLLHPVLSINLQLTKLV